MTSNETELSQNLSQLKQFKDLRPELSVFKVFPLTMRTNGLFDHATARYSCVSDWAATINTLHRCNLNYTPSFTLLGIHVVTGGAFMDSQNYWCWTVDPRTNLIYTEDLITTEKIIEYRLMSEKAAVLDLIYTSLFSYRKSIQKELPFQDLAYHYKEREATLILSGISIREDDHFPFVEGYAEAKGIPLIEAAKEIAFHSNLMRAKLADSERIRVKYQQRVVDCKTIGNMSDITKSFLQEVSVDAAI